MKTVGYIILILIYDTYTLTHIHTQKPYEYATNMRTCKPLVSISDIYPLHCSPCRSCRHRQHIPGNICMHTVSIVYNHTWQYSNAHMFVYHIYNSICVKSKSRKGSQRSVRCVSCAARLIDIEFVLAKIAMQIVLDGCHILTLSHPSTALPMVLALS